MSTLMPQGLVRVCTKSCGYSAYTLHTGNIPCSTPGCDGVLGWPERWRHVCPRGHVAMLLVFTDREPHTIDTNCYDCDEAAKQPTRNTR